MSNNFNRFFVDFDWLYQTAFVEEILNINIAQLIIEGEIKIEKVLTETVVNNNSNIEDFSTLTWNSIKDLISLDNVPKVTEGVLNTFAFSDYTLLIIVILFVLILGLYLYAKEYKTNIYVLNLITIIGYINIKGISKNYYENTDEKFILTVFTVLILCLIILLSNNKSKRKSFSTYTIICISLKILIGFFSVACISLFVRGTLQKYLIFLEITKKLQILFRVFVVFSIILPAYYFLMATKTLLLSYIKTIKAHSQSKVCGNYWFLFSFSALTVQESDPLTTYSNISLIISAFFFILGGILFLNRKYVLRSLLLQKIMRNNYMVFLYSVARYSSEFVLDFNNKAFRVYLIFSHIFLVAFLIIRLGIVYNNPLILNMPFWFCAIICFFALLSTILRSFVKLGYVLETASELTVPIYYSWFETLQALKKGSTQLSKTLWNGFNNQTHKEKIEQITLCGVGIAAIGVGYTGWKSHEANQLAEKANELSKNANELSKNANELTRRGLDVTEVNGDRQAVKDGFMTKENYQKKWDDLGHRRK